MNQPLSPLIQDRQISELGLNRSKFATGAGRCWKLTGCGRQISLWTLLLALNHAALAGSFVTVVDNGNGFNPDPVQIVAGMSVLWVDDGSGPYNISSSDQSWTLTTPGAILFSTAGSYGYYDDSGNQGTVEVSPNVPPSLAITSPATNAVFTAPAAFTFSVNASDTDADGLSDVSFSVGTNQVADVFTGPYQAQVTNLPAGVYTLTAAATDNAGAVTTSSINIQVQAPPAITLTALALNSHQLKLMASGLLTGSTNLLESATSLTAGATWAPLATNRAAGAAWTITNTILPGLRFFRLVQLP